MMSALISLMKKFKRYKSPNLPRQSKKDFKPFPNHPKKCRKPSSPRHYIEGESVVEARPIPNCLNVGKAKISMLQRNPRPRWPTQAAARREIAQKGSGTFRSRRRAKIDGIRTNRHRFFAQKRSSNELKTRSK